MALLPTPAAAHDLKADIPQPDADPVRVVASFDDDTPADGARVTVTDAAGQVVASGTTDDRGVWSFPRPGPGEYTIVVEGAGHRDAIRLKIGEPGVLAEVTSRLRLDRWLGLAIGLAGLLGLTALYVLLRRRPPAGPGS
ncbi:MAG: carboxypeptidase-like regulatory domain-containing protein [Gemmataceae bacterium]|nr:carboxypeptidase-like regulatory domain-containing protein [Gemmataceae bacterium]